jgi:hypothetical protein
MESKNWAFDSKSAGEGKTALSLASYTAQLYAWAINNPEGLTPERGVEISGRGNLIGEAQKSGQVSRRERRAAQRNLLKFWKL